MKKALFLAFLLFAALASAKDYSIPSAASTNAIQVDGSVLVTEQITFAFSGSYSFAYREFDFSRGGQMSGFSVSEGATAYREECSKASGTYCWSGDKVTWYYSADGGQRTFTLAYRLKGAVKAYGDVAEFYWKVWGQGWDKPVGRLTAKVSLPKPVANESVRAW
ncbi:hypothetical protein COY71_02320, partial [Candidatus Micrarchaeota archaeon CG_4_10_14_0_8_um_filter_60_7]